MKKGFPTGLFIIMTFMSFSQDTLNNSNKPKSTATILFICEHGAARSTIAAAWFNKLAQQEGLNYRAVFRGTNPDSVVGPAAQKGLIKDGFDVQGWKPLPVTKHDIDNAYHVVTLDCLMPEKHNVAKPVIEWKGISSISENYIAARDSIVKKVQALINELSLKRKEKE
jgi:arsenate reductase (thioredoxin)